MIPIRRIAQGLCVDPALAELADHPEFWNLIPFRKMRYGGPHNSIDDVWVRYNAWSNFDGDHAKFNDVHESSWYPCADDLPSVKRLVFDVMNLVQGERLGGVLITRVPPHGMVEPHIDGGWHAGYYRKFIVQLKGNLQQAFRFEHHLLRSVSGDVYEFRNDVVHAVTNDSDEERISLIICLRSNYPSLPA